MSRTTNAATLALALLSLAAVDAAAAPGTSDYFRTHTLQCTAGKTDGESLKANQTIITNTYRRTIRKGAQIRIGLYNPIGRVRFVTVTAYRDVLPNATIPMGDSGVYSRCTASVKFWRPLRQTASKIARP